MARAAQHMRSARIDREVDAKLRHLSSEIGVSVSALSARALQRYAEWDAYVIKFGVVDTPTFVVSRLLGYLSEEEMRELGRWVGSTVLLEFVAFRFKEVNAQNVLEVMPRLISKYGRLFRYEQLEEGGRRTVVINHGGGRMFSALYEEVIKAAFAELLHQPVAVETMEHQVVARFAQL